MTTEAVKLNNIRNKLHSLGKTQWLMSADDRGTFLESRSANGEINEVACFHKGALPEEIDFVTSAPDMVGFLLGLVDRAIASARKVKAQQGARQTHNAPRNFAAEASMKCEEPAFKAYLEQQHQLERPLTNERVASKLRSLLAITSRKELNDDAAAAERWRSLRADYETWKRRARG